MEIQENYKFAILGLAAVGKSCITLQYLTNKFVQEYSNTLVDNFNKISVIDGALCNIEILDTSGEEDFSPLRQLWMKNRDGLIFVFSLNEQDSLDELKMFYAVLQSLDPGRKVPLAIVGNKNDLNFPTLMAEKARKFAEECKALYIESSAKTGENIEEIFTKLVRKIREEKSLKTKETVILKQPLLYQQEQKKGMFSVCFNF